MEAKGVESFHAEDAVDRLCGNLWNRAGEGQKPEGAHWSSTEGCRIRATCGNASLDRKKWCSNVIVWITPLTVYSIGGVGS
jgi:hypothetical protein